MVLLIAKHNFEAGLHACYRVRRSSLTTFRINCNFGVPGDILCREMHKIGHSSIIQYLCRFCFNFNCIIIRTYFCVNISKTYFYQSLYCVLVIQMHHLNRRRNKRTYLTLHNLIIININISFACRILVQLCAWSVGKPPA